MRVTEAKNIVKLLNNATADPEVEMFFTIQRNRFEHAVENSLKPIDDETIAQAITSIQDHVGISLTVNQFNGIMFLFPMTRIELATAGLDTLTLEKLMDTVANVFVGSDWPTFGDEVSEDELNTFITGIQRLAALQGFKIVTEQPESAS